MEMKKLIVIGVIFLFIGVAFTPSINSTVVKASNDNDLVEVTSQASGIQGFGNTTVKLTKQQYQSLEQYLVDFRAQLNQTTTREEAVPIFKDAVVELSKYGLLPKGLSVEQTQRLVTMEYRLQNVGKIIEKFAQEPINYFCFFAGKFVGCQDFNIWCVLAYLLTVTFKWGYGWAGLLLLYLIDDFSQMKPLRFMNILEMPSYYSQVIFFYSIGLEGIKQGQLPIRKVIGFTGLKIYFNHEEFYLGYALEIQ